MKNIIQCILNGVDCAIVYCALWAGVIVTVNFFIDTETVWQVKVLISIFIITAFTFGNLTERKQRKVK